MKLHDVSFFFTGHRGCRGLYPENSLPGFIQTLQYPNVNTIELDVIISGDEQVVVSHEAWLHEEFCLDENGNELSAEKAVQYNLYRMPYTQIAQYDCGSKQHPRFPDQKKMKVRKPLLEEVIRLIESTGKKIVWDIEIKSVPEEYGIFQPAPARFSELVLQVVKKFDILDRFILRSFDYAPLQFLHEKYPKVPLCLIVEDVAPPEAHLQKLGFVPFMYSPDFTLVTKESLSFFQEKNCKVVPWTVNETTDMKRLTELGVDGLISDYPDRFTKF